MTIDEALALTKRERELQADICELEWPDDKGEQFAIMALVHAFMIETEATQTWTGTVIGWPRKTLADRLTRFRSSKGERLASGARQHGEPDTAVAKAQRILKANPDAVLADGATARAAAGAMTDNPTARKIVEAAFEAPPLEPTNGRSRATVEAQAPGEMLLLEFYAWYVRGKKLLGVAQEAGKLNKRGREDLEETAELARSLIDLITTVATSGDWDEELAAMIDEGA